MLKRLVLILIVFLTFQTRAGSLGQLDFFYSPNPDAHESILNAIGAAKKSVKMKMFRMSNPVIAEALIDAAKRGVDVFVIFDRAQWKSENDVLLVESMTKAGVMIMKATTKFTLTHEKAMIIDDRKAMISTMNMIKRIMQMVDYGVFTTNPGIVQEMAEVYEVDWKNAEEGTGETPKLSDPYLIWSPVNTEEKLIKLIKKAKSEVEVIVENISHPKIVQALIEVASKGVDVRVISPKCNLTMLSLNYPATVELRKAGVNAKMYPGPTSEKFPYVHAKSIVVDGQSTYLGSVNFTVNSVNKAREVGVILPDESTSKKVNSIFETLWKDTVLPPADETYTCVSDVGPDSDIESSIYWTRLINLFNL